VAAHALFRRVYSGAINSWMNGGKTMLPLSILRVARRAASISAPVALLPAPLTVRRRSGCEVPPATNTNGGRL
jgi:hypothetical protein